MMVSYFKFGDLERVKAFIVHRLIDAPVAEPARFGVINKDTSTDPPTFTPRLAYCQLAEKEGANPPGCS